MAKYSTLLGTRVQVEYRAGDIYLPAVGKLSADSGKSIFLEEHFEKNESVRTFRWEIPYQCIVRIKQVAADAPVNSTDAGDMDRGAA
jgi:hypothetical protein